MLYADLRVSIPQGPQYEVIPVRGQRYLYYRKGSKRIDGKLKHFRWIIGRIIVENDEPKLIPNDKYFSLMGLPQPKGERIQGPGRSRKRNQKNGWEDVEEVYAPGGGYGIACEKISREIGLWDVLAEVFGDAGRDVLAIAAYLAKEDASGMSGLELFIQKQRSLTDAGLTLQTAGAFYKLITPEVRAEFFSRWIKRHGADSSVCYDVAGLTGSSNDFPAAACGYSWDRARFSQIHLGLFCAVSDGLPLCYADYNGSINNFSNLQYVKAKAAKYGIHDEFLAVMDGGSFASGEAASDAGLPSLKGQDFLMGAPVDFGSELRQLLLDWRNSADAEKNILEVLDEPIRAAEVHHTFGASDLRVLMYKPSVRSSDEECLLTRCRYVMAESLAQLQGKMTAAASKQYDGFFDISLKENGRFEYSLKEEEIKDAQSLCGCFALLCSREDLSLYDAMLLYHAKDEVEEAFGGLKDDILPERLQLLHFESLHGKIFLSFLGLIIRKVLSNKLSKWLLKKRISLNAAIDMLCDIECRKHQSIWLLSRPCTALQVELIKILDLSVNYLKSTDTK